MAVPTYDDLFNPLLESMHLLGGSANISEQEEKVADILKLSDQEINEIHRGNRTKLSYRLAWARNYLKRYGLLENSSRGVWVLTKDGSKTRKIKKLDVIRKVKKLDKNAKPILNEDNIPESEFSGWRDDLLDHLKKLSPQEFEKLCQRVLRESGFIQVEVTGRSGDGGIDGRGMVKIGGFLSFRVIFQCKRYKGPVSSKDIREFKGTMVGRAEKGLFITTGTFTREAKAEASRDGAPPIDLVNGEELAEKMKELRLGVKVVPQESVEIDENWFKNF